MMGVFNKGHNRICRIANAAGCTGYYPANHAGFADPAHPVHHLQQRDRQ